MVDTPTDEVEVAAPTHTRANRYQLFDDGEGDYRIYEIAGGDEAGVPKGALLPIAGVAGFESGAKAKHFITRSGDQLAGKQVMVLKGLEICVVQVQTVAKVTPNWKPKKAVHGPALTESAGA